MEIPNKIYLTENNPSKEWYRSGEAYAYLIGWLTEQYLISKKEEL